METSKALAVLGKRDGREYRLKSYRALCARQELCSIFLSGQGSLGMITKISHHTMSQLPGIKHYLVCRNGVLKKPHSLWVPGRGAL